MLDIRVVSMDELEREISHHHPDYIISAVPDSEWQMQGKEIAKPSLNIPRSVIAIECAPFDPENSDYAALPWQQPDSLQGNARSVSDLIELGKQLLIKKSNMHVLVHCQQGVCRSPALALILMALDRGPGHEEEAANQAHSACPHSRPSGELVALADAALERGGRLVKAWQEEFSHPFYKPTISQRARGSWGDFKNYLFHSQIATE